MASLCPALASCTLLSACSTWPCFFAWPPLLRVFYSAHCCYTAWSVYLIKAPDGSICLPLAWHSAQSRHTVNIWGMSGWMNVGSFPTGLQRSKSCWGRIIEIGCPEFQPEPRTLKNWIWSRAQRVWNSSAHLCVSVLWEAVRWDFLFFIFFLS